MADSTAWFYSHQGQQQGPVSVEQLRGFLSAGQLQPTAMVWCDGMPNWAAAQSVRELWADVVPPTLPPASAPFYSPQQMYQPAPDIGQNAGIRMLLPVGRSGWAIAAGYLGLFSVLACPAPIALVISIIAIIDIRKHPQRHGMGRATFGLVMGILGTGILILGASAMMMNHR